MQLAEFEQLVRKDARVEPHTGSAAALVGAGPTPTWCSPTRPARGSAPCGGYRVSRLAVHCGARGCSVTPPLGARRRAVLGAELGGSTGCRSLA